MATVRSPAPLRKLFKNADVVSVNSTTIMSLIEDLEFGYPGIQERLLNESQELRTFVNIYKNNEDIRFLAGLDTEIMDSDEISIVPAIAGG